MFRTTMTLMIAILASQPFLLANQQAKVDPQSYQYKKDYAEVEELMKEADSEKRANSLLAFLKERPKSGMIQYVSGYYAQIVAGHQQAANWPKVIKMSEDFLALLPDDLATQRTLMAAYYQSQNFPKAAALGEKLYAKNPDKAMATDLASLYLQLKNYDKYLVYGGKILEAFPMKDAYRTALQMANIYLQKQDVEKATDLMSKVMNVYSDSVPQGFKESDWNGTRTFSYGLLGARAYRNKDYPRAMELYSRVAQYAPQADEPYYRIGMSKWQSKDTEGAMPYFAKASVLKKQFAPKATEYLEQLYKARNNDSLEGLEKILDGAKQELGISD